MISSVSVVVPTYNRPVLVQRAVESALAAATVSRLRVDVTVVDNASPESPFAALEARFGSRVRVVLNERNLGVTGNWNRCREIAQDSECDAWLLLEDDNCLTLNFFEDVVRAFQETPDAKVVFTACTQFDDGGAETVWSMWSVSGGTLRAGRTAERELLSWAFTCAMKISSVVVRRTPALRGLPAFTEDYYSCQDVSGLCELAMAAGSVAYVAAPLMRYYLNPQSISASARRNADLQFSELLRALRHNTHRLLASGRFSLDDWATAAANAPLDRLIAATLSLYGKLPPDVQQVRETFVRALIARNRELRGSRRLAGALLGKWVWAIAMVRAQRIALLRRGDVRTADYATALSEPVPDDSIRMPGKE